LLCSSRQTFDKVPHITSLHKLNTLGTGYLNCLYAYKRKFASPVLNVLIAMDCLLTTLHGSMETLQTLFYDPMQSGTSVIHMSQFCASVLLLLLIVGY
jgi:hypothetical protein